jgi:5-methylcytosine-specific restriction endonuclease McrA
MSELVFIYPKNPRVFELVKNNTRRYLALDTIKGEKGCCKWCMDKLDNTRKKYCSNNCKESAWAFFYPQKYSHKYLMKRQSDCCLGCGYNFNDKTKKFIRRFYGDTCEYTDYGDVDHIIPIHKGGEILGIENVQLLCRECHIKKTASERRKQ